MIHVKTTQSRSTSGYPTKYTTHKQVYVLGVLVYQYSSELSQ